MSEVADIIVATVITCGIPASVVALFRISSAVAVLSERVERLERGLESLTNQVNGHGHRKG